MKGFVFSIKSFGKVDSKHRFNVIGLFSRIPATVFKQNMYITFHRKLQEYKARDLNFN